MKNILFLGMVLLLSGCGKEDKGNDKWDLNAMISLRAAQPVRTARAAGHLTPREIVEKTFLLRFHGLGSDLETERGFSEPQRDFANERLLMWGTDIIDHDGRYHPDFIEGNDMVLVIEKVGGSEGERGDTIAYIPNSVLREAAKITKPAFERGDYATCYEVFDKAFTFIPITGAEWRALKANNEN